MGWFFSRNSGLQIRRPDFFDQRSRFLAYRFSGQPKLIQAHCQRTNFFGRLHWRHKSATGTPLSA